MLKKKARRGFAAPSSEGTSLWMSVRSWGVDPWEASCCVCSLVLLPLSTYMTINLRKSKVDAGRGCVIY
jgi:hypothetical protein